SVAPPNSMRGRLPPVQVARHTAVAYREIAREESPVAQIKESTRGAAVTPAKDVIVDVQNVSRVYGAGHNAVHALKHVNLEVPPHKLVAITGRSGSGKTTLLNLIG